MKVLAVIIARGGSKGVPRKNALDVAGKPLMAWTIEAALNCPDLDRVILSTEDDELMKLGRQWGAEVPFRRPRELASDHATASAVIKHAFHWLKENQFYHPDFIMLLQSASPLRTSEDISHAIQMLQDKNADSLISVTEAHHHPSWMFRVDPEHQLSRLDPNMPSRRQDLETLFTVNGAIYMTRTELFLQNENWYNGRCVAYEMPQERSVDVDNPFDLRIARMLLNEKRVSHDQSIPSLLPIDS